MLTKTVVLKVENDYYIQIYRHYLEFFREIGNIKSHKKRFDLSVLLWLFKYWYLNNEKQLETKIKNYLIGNVDGFFYSYLKQVEERKKSDITKEEKLKAFINYSLMSHLSLEEIMNDISHYLSKPSVIDSINIIRAMGIVAVYNGIHPKNNSYLYNPKPLNQYIENKYLGKQDKTEDIELINELKKLGYVTDTPTHQTPKRKTEKPAEPVRTQETNTWSGFLEWARLQKGITKKTYENYTLLKILEESEKLIVSGELEPIPRQIVEKYYSQIIKKELIFK
jgi:hypothetical protein